jgi:hypothetical protein
VPTHALEPELAVAYVHELSADVQAVVILDAAGNRLAGPEALAAPARTLAAHGDAILTTAQGTVWIATTDDCTLVAVAGPGAPPGPTFLDAKAALGAAPPTPIPSPEHPQTSLQAAVSDVFQAT